MSAKSDIDNPIAFFESFINEQVINRHYSNYFQNIIDSDENVVINDGYLILEEMTEHSNVYIRYSYEEGFRKLFDSLIVKQVEISKKLIDKLAEDKLDIENKFYKKFNQTIQIKVSDKIDYLLKTQASLFLKYPILKTGLSEIVDYINTSYNQYLTDPLFLDETIIEKDLYNLNTMSFDDLFNQLFSFMLDEKMIDKIDYERLYHYTKTFVNRQKVQNIEKIPTIVIQDGILHSLFGIICKKYKHIKVADMAEFLESSLDNYSSENTIHTFTKKYSSAIDIAKHPYLSAFVKGYFKKK